MKRFCLERTEDKSGVSGVGKVAEGVEFSNRQCVICWLSDTSSTGIYKSIEDIEHIHGHGDKTKVVWIDSNKSRSIQLLDIIGDKNLGVIERVEGGSVYEYCLQDDAGFGNPCGGTILIWTDNDTFQYHLFGGRVEEKTNYWGGVEKYWQLLEEREISVKEFLK